MGQVEVSSVFGVLCCAVATVVQLFRLASPFWMLKDDTWSGLWYDCLTEDSPDKARVTLSIGLVSSDSDDAGPVWDKAVIAIETAAALLYVASFVLALGCGQCCCGRGGGRVAAAIVSLIGSLAVAASSGVLFEFTKSMASFYFANVYLCIVVMVFGFLAARDLWVAGRSKSAEDY